MSKLFYTLIILSINLLQFVSAEEEMCRISTLTDGTQTDDCPSLHSCVDNICVHKDLFPLEAIEVGGVILTILLTGLASSGGIGGGTVLTPILLIFFRYSEKEAVMVVYSMIFGGGVANFLTSGLKRNSKTRKPFLNYDLSLICMPPMLFGTSLGVIVNRMIARVVIVTGLVLLTIYTFTKLSKKAKNEYKKETHKKNVAAAAAAQEAVETKPIKPEMTTRQESEVEILSKKESATAPSSLESVNNPGSPEIITNPSSISLNEGASEPGVIPSRRLQAILREEKKLFPFRKLVKIFGLLGFMILITILRGTKTFDSPLGADYCGVGYWLLFFVGLIGCFICSFINIRALKSDLQVKKANNYVDQEEGFVLTEKHVVKLSILSLIAGVLAGMFGIGGGMIMSPTLLSFGLDAQSLAATSGFFVIQTSLLSLISAILSQEIPIEVFGFFLVVSFFGSFVVSYILRRLVQKYERPSIILFTLVFVILLSLIATPTFVIINNIDDLGKLLIFNPIC